jgi:hypothetical protein
MQKPLPTADQSKFIAAEMNGLFDFAERTRNAARRWRLAEIGGIFAVAGGITLVLTGEPTEGVVMASLGAFVSWESDKQRRQYNSSALADQNEAEEIHGTIFNDLGEYRPDLVKTRPIIRPIPLTKEESNAL